MEKVNMHEAKTRLSSLVERALAGEEVIIAKAGTPLVRLVPVGLPGERREAGRFRGQIKLAEDFDQTPEELIRSFEGE